MDKILETIDSEERLQQENNALRLLIEKTNRRALEGADKLSELTNLLFQCRKNQEGLHLQVKILENQIKLSEDRFTASEEQRRRQEEALNAEINALKGEKEALGLRIEALETELALKQEEIQGYRNPGVRRAFRMFLKSVTAVFTMKARESSPSGRR